MPTRSEITSYLGVFRIFSIMQKYWLRNRVALRYFNLCVSSASFPVSKSIISFLTLYYMMLSDYLDKLALWDLIPYNSPCRSVCNYLRSSGGYLGGTASLIILAALPRT
jgi:hypothetical protein